MSNSTDLLHQVEQTQTGEQLPPHQTRPGVDPVAIGLQIEGISPWRRELSGRIVSGVVASIRCVTQRFFWALNGLNALMFGLAFLAPLLAAQGWGWFYQKIFQACHLVCVQDHNHSFSLFGYQMPLCERCLALYGSMFLGGVAFQVAQAQPRRFNFDLKLKRLPFWGLVLMSLPIALDGFSQMFGWRQSNWELRLLTGAIFGSGIVWYVYPQLADRLQMAKKLVSSDRA